MKERVDLKDLKVRAVRVGFSEITEETQNVINNEMYCVTGAMVLTLRMIRSRTCLFVRCLDLRIVSVSGWVLGECLNLDSLDHVFVSIVSVSMTKRGQHFVFFSCFTDLEVRALTQDVMADVQVVLRWWLGCVTLCLSLCTRYTQLTSLGKCLEVVGRHCPEVKI